MFDYGMIAARISKFDYYYFLFYYFFSPSVLLCVTIQLSSPLFQTVRGIGPRGSTFLLGLTGNQHSFYAIVKHLKRHMVQEILLLCVKVWHFQTESVVLTSSPVVGSYMRPLPSAENLFHLPVVLGLIQML